MTSEAGFDFDFNRAEVLSWIRLGTPDGWSIIYNMSTGPELVQTARIELRVIPEIGQHTGRTLVDVVGKGAAARAIVAAEDLDKIIRYIDPKHPFYRSPPDIGFLKLGLPAPR